MLLHSRFQIGGIWILDRDDVAVVRVACESGLWRGLLQAGHGSFDRGASVIPVQRSGRIGISPSMTMVEEVGDVRRQH
jgi:hypothetical protein